MSSAAQTHRISRRSRSPASTRAAAPSSPRDALRRLPTPPFPAPICSAGLVTDGPSPLCAWCVRHVDERRADRGDVAPYIEGEGLAAGAGQVVLRDIETAAWVQGDHIGDVAER